MGDAEIIDYDSAEGLLSILNKISKQGDFQYVVKYRSDIDIDKLEELENQWLGNPKRMKNAVQTEDFYSLETELSHG